jgi:AraC-like DNA-binding protein
MREAIRQKIMAIQAARHQDDLHSAARSEAIRQKIQAALAAAKQDAAPQRIAESIANGERLYTLKKASQLSGISSNALAGRLRGSQDFCNIRIVERSG